MSSFASPGVTHALKLFPADRREYGTKTAFVRLIALVLVILLERLPGGRG